MEGEADKLERTTQERPCRRRAALSRTHERSDVSQGILARSLDVLRQPAHNLRTGWIERPSGVKQGGLSQIVLSGDRSIFTL